MGKKRYTLDNFKDLKKDITGEEYVEEIITETNTIDPTVKVVNHISKIVNNDRRANAPYNFVSLNNKVVRSDFNIKNTPFNKYHSDKKTGYIDLNISTQTPMYIRGNKDVNEDEKTINPDFFAPGNGKLRIPGSSIRGLLRSMVEIVSFGKFGSFDDISLYFRSFDKTSLSKEYKQFKLTGFKDGKSSLEIGCGVLKRKGVQFLIEDSGKPKQIKKEESKIKIGDNYNEFNFFTFDTEYIVVSGNMQNKKNDWLISKPANGCNQIILSNEDVNNYKNDLNRTDKIDLLKKLKDVPNGIPCFYKQWKDDKQVLRTTFGHTGMFRIPYKKSIGEHIPSFLTNDKDKDIDIAEAIFGNEKNFSGRVFVEDSFSLNPINSESLLGVSHPKILSGPKPTTFQHYLTQISEKEKELKHYNTDSSAIRGNKIYWHKDNEYEWKENDAVPDNDKQHTKINPVREDTVFTGRIRFENLSDVELGALIFALDLPEGCLHKIGMGKPLGLGSIRIKAGLHISDRINRYSDLLNEWTENLPESKEPGKFKDIFADFVLKQLYENDKSYTSENLWEEERMKELKRMLDWKNKPENKKTNYMELREFKVRPVLPRPTDVR
jgi:CRISPR/Cas system CSM-associated protein Csm3 (group 7 of RAMP superfamily)